MNKGHVSPRSAHKALKGKPVARRILSQVKSDVAALKAQGWQPRLLSVSIGDCEPSKLYIRNQRRVAEQQGIEFDELILDESVTLPELLPVVAARNADPRITGIIIQRPLPRHLDVQEAQQTIHPLKDVEGMHPTSLGKVVYNQAEMAPCTAKAAVELLRQTGLEMKGLEAVVVGHSEIVGKPISFLLMKEGCTVTICHHMTRNLSMFTRSADAVLVAVGKAGLIDGSMIKPGAAIIDVGINQLSDGKVVGDVDYETAEQVAGWITPVPGGVGTVTTAMLMQNTVFAARRQQSQYETTMSFDQDIIKGRSGEESA